MTRTPAGGTGNYLYRFGGRNLLGADNFFAPAEWIDRQLNPDDWPQHVEIR
jgi:hypothetical protein